jgi:hypothetical protein
LAGEGNLRAFAALSGVVSRRFRDGIAVPTPYTWGDPALEPTGVALLDDEWAAISQPKHRAVFSDLAHWDYLPAGRVPCETSRGPCSQADVVAWDLLTMFFGKYLPPPAVAGLPSRIPETLLPPTLNLTTEQQFFAGGWLSGFGSMEDEGTTCQVTISFETSSASGTVRKP